ncbi:protein GAMETOPHYTE DEFECTIVE 1 isoform X2 [Spinacia oleracea]|uniref:Protein GAMETOPHYTE DEFECTIVE 1 isoform X2 n=1 Tax=Spinacia oleracea TaxID=3562 RepID=A0ABM3QTM3_SPIOL|nr:protein GAMETOPHYTE DEFECTIVE 1 isoform X2 [Spinacia oleracea]
MLLFDLNIPYCESDKSVSDKSSKKQTRLKLIVKAIEFGYTGIAYNRTIKGVMSESDRCTISPFSLSSLLKLSPSLSSTVCFHRRLLGVPENSAFRQYTRLTMLVETSAQASALNSGNPILKTYDLIAVRPLNQNSFDLACQSSQVDLISIDFADKLPFRLKLPMVKAAIARGVYFEIMYSSLMQDVHVRRQMISNAKLLVEWTQGKNLIVSSAAPSVLELRGLNDVANLLLLLGLSNERAKATISKNCRLLIANTLRKKQFYKEAIRVEVMPLGVETDPGEPWIVDHIDWDPLSSGEGDLLLDDMAKAFAESAKVSQTMKGVVSSPIVNHMQSHGLHVNNIGYTTPKDLEVSKKTDKPENEPTSLWSSLLDQQGNNFEDSLQAVLPDSSVACSNVEDFRNYSTKPLLEAKNSYVLETTTSIASHVLEPPDHVNNADIVQLSDSMKEIISKDYGLDVGCIAISRKEVLMESEGLNCNGQQTDKLKLASVLVNRIDAGIPTEMQLCDQSDSSLGGNLLELKEDTVAEKNARNVMVLDSFSEGSSSDGLPILRDRQLLEEVEEIIEQKGNRIEVNTGSDNFIVEDTMMLLDSLQQGKKGNDHLVAKSTLSDEMMECRKQVKELSEAEHQPLGENKSGNHKVKRWGTGQVLRFPFKRLLQVQFKKKRKTSMYKIQKRK